MCACVCGWGGGGGEIVKKKKRGGCFVDAWGVGGPLKDLIVTISTINIG